MISIPLLWGLVLSGRIRSDSMEATIGLHKKGLDETVR